MSGKYKWRNLWLYRDPSCKDKKKEWENQQEKSCQVQISDETLSLIFLKIQNLNGDIVGLW